MHDINDQPTFLVGSERSGTTMLRLMLDHHPQLAFNKESEFIVNQIHNDEFPSMTDYIEFLKQDRVFAHSHFSINENLSYKDLVNDFLYQKKTRDKKKFVGATVHYQFDKLLKIWPGAKFIFLVRDPRDVASSIINMGWAGNHFVAVEWWLDALKELKRVRQLVSDDRIITVRYEDLLEKPSEVLAGICHFIGIDFSEQMYDYVKNSTYSHPDYKYAFQWKNKLSPMQIRLCESRVYSDLTEWGYELHERNTTKLNPLQIIVLKFHSRVKCALFRIESLGFSLWIKNYFARKLNLKSLIVETNKKINQIVDSKLQ